MEYIIAFIILLLSIIVLMFFVLFNLLKKYEKLEEYVSNISLSVENITEKLEEIDSSGLFESDDEIGWFFEEIKKLGDQLARFIR
jgi:HAMP domain-containing protein